MGYQPQEAVSPQALAKPPEPPLPRQVQAGFTFLPIPMTLAGAGEEALVLVLTIPAQ